MMFRTAFLVAFLANIAHAANNVREGSFAKSSAAEKLLKSARKLNNNQQEENTWMAKYEIQFDTCYSMPQVAGREGGGGEENDGLFMQHVVKLKLCPADECISGRSCKNGYGEYLVDMADYVQAYMEFKEEAKEQACENVRENCYCNDNQDDQACQNQCFQEKGLSYCIENQNNNGQEEFKVEDYLECNEMRVQNNNNNNNNNYQQYFVGPYCSPNGKNVYLGVFNDAGCVNRVDSSIYNSKNYGADLPYAEESMVEADCISCKEVEENNNNNNNNYYQEPKVIELCERTYEDAAKCERNLGSSGPYYKSNTACDYIENTLPKLAKVYAGKAVHATSTSTIFAWIFGLSTVGLGALVFYMYKNPAKVAMAARDGFLA